MDRNTLNNEIVLCRPVVRRARVIVIRKILKKMKILQSCKNVAEKEKKMKKADKLYFRIQIIKKLRDDEVTKFALLNENYEAYLKNSSENPKDAALASLAKNDGILKVITKIREMIPNWKTELPLVLKKKKNIKKKSNLRDEGVQNIVKVGNKEKVEFKHTTNFYKKKRVPKYENTSKHLTLETPKTKLKGFIQDKNKQESNSAYECDMSKRIDDPFFIEKRVAAPALLRRASMSRENHNKEIFTLNPRELFNKKKSSHTPIINDHDKKIGNLNDINNLHPSWAAKKIKTTIKPFEGKKIKFSPD